MTIRIGANPICWSNDDMPEIGGWIPLEQCLTEAKASASRAWNSATSFRANRQSSGRSSKAYGLDLVGGWHSTSCSNAMPRPNSRKRRAHRKLLKDMGANVLIVAECTRTVHGDKSAPLSTRPVMTRWRMEDFHARADAIRRTAPR